MARKSRKICKSGQSILKRKGRGKKHRHGPKFELNITPEKKRSVKELETEILKGVELTEDVREEDSERGGNASNILEQIVFRSPAVIRPLQGTPKQVRTELDALVKKMQKNPKNNEIFDKVHRYIHCYLINLVLKKFPFIKGLQTVDIYQEALIALRFKAIPNFKSNKGMSFLNFAKMCIRRHLITLLNASKNRKKDQSMNQAISLDSSPIKESNEDDSRTNFGNIIADNKATVDKVMESNEAYYVTKKTLFNVLSDFERVVLTEYLSNVSYCEISKNISAILRKKHKPKSIDNALLRIRKKAIHLLRIGKKEELPIFMSKP